jgi:uncharacterized protein YqfA (UPF0365 family)
MLPTISDMLAQVPKATAPQTQPGGDMSVGWIIGLAIGGVVLLVLLIVVGQFFGLWIQALFSRAGISMRELIGMRLRKVDLRTIVFGKIQAVKAGLQVTTADLETHYLAGGRVRNVINALIAANKAKINLDWRTGTAIDLAGRDILDAVHTSVNPKVIDCPDLSKGRSSVDGVSKDGIQVKARARVTVRTNIERLVGGATEETIIARVGEGIVATIGNAETYKDVLENPDRISKMVLAKGLDAGTAFEILSIDIADVDVGDNVGAKLQGEQAQADMRRAQAAAEARRAMAVAQEQENRASVEANRAKVVLAEAEVPLAMAEAFRKGVLGVMDYYKMQNVQADTTMRSALGKAGEGK